MNNDEVIRLTLDVNSKAVPIAAAAIDKAKDSTVSFAAALDQLDDGLVELDQPAKRATESMTEFQRALKFDAMADELVDDLRQINTAIDTTAAHAGKVEAATAKVGKSSVNMGQSLLQGSRALQDFTQGGIGGVLNNIEGVASALGASAGVAGAATAIGVAIAVAGPPFLRFLGSLVGSGPGVKTLKEQLEAVADAIGKLSEKQVLNNKEMAEYNKLAQEQGRLDKEAASNKARLAAMSAQPGDRGPKDKAIGELVSDAAIGNQAAITAQATEGLARAMGENYLGAHGDRMRTLSLKSDEAGNHRTAAEEAELRKLREGYDTARGGAGVEAQNLLAKAMAGDVDAAKKLIANMPPGAVRDSLVIATISDRTKDEARFQGRQFLENTLGQGVRGIRDRNSKTREWAGGADIAGEMEDEANRDIARAAAEKARADADTVRLRGQANAERERGLAKKVKWSQGLKEVQEKPDLPRIPYLNPDGTEKTVSKAAQVNEKMLALNGQMGGAMQAMYQRLAQQEAAIVNMTQQFAQFRIGVQARNNNQVTLRRGNR